MASLRTVQLLLLCLAVASTAILAQSETTDDTDSEEKSAEATEASEEEDDGTYKCYVCNSSNDPEDCEEYDENQTADKYLVDCNKDEYKPNHFPFILDGKKIAEPVGCRKILQEVQSEATDGETVTHVVRQCAYSGPVLDGQKRTGNKGVRLWYYQCLSPKCNGASRAGTLAAFAITCVTLLAKLL